MKKKLDAYRGRLSAARIAEGMNAAAKNARRLSEDAAILLAAGRFPTAGSVAVLAIEEAGKVSILRALALAASDAEAAEAWKDYRSHTRKNVAWLLPELAAAGARKLDDLRPLFDETSDHPFVLDQIKQLGFYTDCLGKAHWAIPSDTIDEGLARILVRIAQLFARDREYSQKEVKLWIEHIGPIWKKDPSWMKQALVNWYAAMQVAGLAAEGPNEMEQFIRHGLQENGV
jgi:AbiV family abortive infection protein